MAKKKTEVKQQIREVKSPADLPDEILALLAAGDYKAVAEVGANWGAYLLEEELNDGVSEEKVNFMPEAHIFAKEKLVGVALLEAKSSEDLDKYIAAIFEREPITAVLLVQGNWMSEMAAANGGRASQQPDRVNAGIGLVYLAPDNIVAGAGKPVFSKKTRTTETPVNNSHIMFNDGDLAVLVRYTEGEPTVLANNRDKKTKKEKFLREHSVDASFVTTLPRGFVKKLVDSLKAAA